MTISNINLEYKNFSNRDEVLLILLNQHLHISEIEGTSLARFGMNDLETNGKHISEIFPRLKIERRLRYYLKMIEKGQALQIRQIKFVSENIPFIISAHAFKVKDGIAVVLTNLMHRDLETVSLQSLCYRLSHDIRSRNASLVGLIRLAKSELKQAEVSNPYFEKMEDLLIKMNDFLSGYIPNNRSFAAYNKLELLDFNQLIEDTKKALAFLPGFDEIAFEQFVAIDRDVYGGKSLIISILQNLIDNAIKYKKHGSKSAYVKLAVQQVEKGINIIVKDNGIGIPEKHLGEIFRMFYRASDQASGSGMGLYTVADAVSRLKGEISVSSKENEWTQFNIFLPL